MIDKFQNDIQYEDFICFLQPTSPFRRLIDLQEAISIVNEGRFDSIISLSHFFFDDLFYTYIEEEGFIRPVLPEYFGKRRQEFPKLLKRNGSFYFIKVASLIEFESLLSNRNGYKICTGSESAINIDTIEDLALARKLVNEFTESYIQN